MTTEHDTPAQRTRRSNGPAVLAQGFRPFFLLAGMWAAAALAIFVATLEGRIELPTAFSPVNWHAHEMLFGYISAAIAGFLLTAIPNWTGRLPIHGVPLLGLALVWVAGRVAVAASERIGAGTAALIDLAFLFLLCAVTLREIVAGRNWRNLPIILVIGVLLTLNALMHAELIGLSEPEGVARRGGVAMVIVLITLVGGRIVPSFTRNWLAKRNARSLPGGFGVVDRLTLAVTPAAFCVWALRPDSGLTAGLCALAAALNLIRLIRWRGHQTHPEPLLWILHLAYLWIPVGLGLIALSHWWPALPASGALHALTSGAMGTMTLAVMSRTTLGHTGRALHAGQGLTAAYLCVTVATLLRILSGLSTDWDGPLLMAAALAWVAAFVLFLAVCGPMLVARRRDGDAGDAP